MADVAAARRARRSSARSVDGRLTLGRPGRLRGPRRNLLKLAARHRPRPDRRATSRTARTTGPRSSSACSAPTCARELGGHDPFRRHRDYFDRVAGEHWLNQLLYVDQKTFLPCLNLTYTDKMSMAASTEVRVPLLDDELVELAGRIPPELKLRRLTRKYIFKKSMEGMLPHEHRSGGPRPASARRSAPGSSAT